MNRGDENARPANCNLLQSLQRDNEMLQRYFLITFRRELRLTIEQKEREIHEKDQLLQNLQLRLVGVSVMFHVQSAVDSKIRQFDTLGKLFMEQNTKLKAKEEEVSNLSTVVQKQILFVVIDVDSLVKIGLSRTDSTSTIEKI